MPHKESAAGMFSLLQNSAVDFVHFLEVALPKLSSNWWKVYVVDSLTPSQRDHVRDKDITTLGELDFAALLRIMERNWTELSRDLVNAREARNWLRELQNVRNRWAHRAVQETNDDRDFRDIDTLYRFLKILPTADNSLDEVEKERSQLLNNLVMPTAGSSVCYNQTNAPNTTTGISTSAEHSPEEPEDQDGSEHENQLAKYEGKEFVALITAPLERLPIVDIDKSSDQVKYRLFYDGQLSWFYEYQLTECNERKVKGIASAGELLAYLTSKQLLFPSMNDLFSMRSGRITHVPYQYRPVLKLIRSDRPRLLIADEVGVGKTIESGLIIKELKARMGISSVLIICPKPLVSERKWVNEMKRFDEDFIALDGRTLRHSIKECHLEGEWPNVYSKCVIPFSLFDSELLHGGENRRGRKRIGLFDLDKPPKFDLVLVDEAHHIRNSSTYLHQAVRYFCDNAQAAVLLTATPIQLGDEDLFTLLNVLRPDQVIDKASFNFMAEPNEAINSAINILRGQDENRQKEALIHVEAISRTAWGRDFISGSPDYLEAIANLSDTKIDDKKRLHTIGLLEGMYTFSSMINRTRRRDIGEFTVRQAKTINIDYTPEQREFYDELMSLVYRMFEYSHGHVNIKFMTTTIRRQAASCLYGLVPVLERILLGRLDKIEGEESEYDEIVDQQIPEAVDGFRAEIEAILHKAEKLEPHDPKVIGLVNLLQQKSKMEKNKTLLFSTFRHTLAYIHSHVMEAGLRVGLIHGDIPEQDRRTLRERFSLEKSDDRAIDVLLSSEVGCEGLDFQFCDHLVNYDLPWNPMRIEQRIGRIDRYGQRSESVVISNIITPGTVDADIYERCLLRIGVFKKAIGGNEEILGNITSSLQELEAQYMLSASDTESRMQQISDNAIRKQQEDERLEKEQSTLFGLKVPKATWEEEIRKTENYWFSPALIEVCITSYLKALSGSDLDHLMGKGSVRTLRMNQDLRDQLLVEMQNKSRQRDPDYRKWEKYLKGAEPNISVTFQQLAASEDPNIVYLSVLHPFVQQAAKFHDREDAPSVSLTVRDRSLPAGKHHFALYKWKKIGLNNDESLIPVSSDSDVETRLMNLFHECEVLQGLKIDTEQLNPSIDERHHDLWFEARGGHKSYVENMIDHRIKSLDTSHTARIRSLDEKIAAASDTKINKMHLGTKANAESDYRNRKNQLLQSREQSDIHHEIVLIGEIEVSH